MSNMNGREHFEEAERLLDHAGDPMTQPDRANLLVGRAQVHAILALAMTNLSIATANIPAPQANGIWRGWGENE